MTKHSNDYSADNPQGLRAAHAERGAALSTALIVMSLLAAISMTVLAVVTHEARIAGSDLQRTQTFYAADAGLEKMTNDFSKLFAKTRVLVSIRRCLRTPPRTLGRSPFPTDHFPDCMPMSFLTSLLRRQFTQTRELRSVFSAR